ncbi:hypothetical protein MEX01_45520 [Methylorubrum extorquens]|nr:hypothetical protein MEX01_45520 [Methylorubrum extorquens]
MDRALRGPSSRWADHRLATDVPAKSLSNCPSQRGTDIPNARCSRNRERYATVRSAGRTYAKQRMGAPHHQA